MLEAYEWRNTDHVERTTESVLRDVLTAFGQDSLPRPVLLRALRAMYAVSEAHWNPMPDVHAVLATLERKQYRLGLISNAGDEGNVQRLIDKASLRRFLNPILISAAVGVRKPAPELFRMVLEAWGLPGSQVVMVGDLLGADILGAQRAGLHQIWLTAQADSPSNQGLEGQVVPEAVAASLSEVPGLIELLGTAGD
jgi:putative hydrolase of the HAD superfamily